MLKLIVSAVGVFALSALGCGDSGTGGSGGGTGGAAPGGAAPGGASAGGANAGGANAGGANAGGEAAGGADPTGGASGDLQHSCDQPADGSKVHLCTDWAYPTKYADFFSDAQADCEREGNTFGAVCDTTGAVGGCRTTDTGAPGITVTTWVYTGTTADVMAYCTTLTATFVAP